MCVLFAKFGKSLFLVFIQRFLLTLPLLQNPTKTKQYRVRDG